MPGENGCSYLAKDDGGLLGDFVRETNLQLQTLQIMEGKDEDLSKLCYTLSEKSKLLHQNIVSMRDLLDNCRKQLTEQKAHAAKIKEIEGYVQHMENNLPSHFTYVPADDIEADYTVARIEEHGNLDSPNNSSLFAGSFLSPEVNGNGYVIGTPILPPVPAKLAAIKTIPCIAYLTQDEFKSLPKYLKGRTCLTFKAINTLVDSFNSALNTKYKIVTKPMSSLKFEEKQMYFRYKSQDNAETKGTYFITKEDLKNSGQQYISNTFDSMMAILRSQQRMHEIRGGGVVRYAVGPKK